MWRLAICFILCSCAGGGAVQTEIDAFARNGIAADPANYTNGDSRSWVIRRDGINHGLLWGTFHRGYDEATIPPSAIRDKVESAADLTVELNLAEMTPAGMTALIAPCARASRIRDEGAIASLDPAAKSALDAMWLPGDIKTTGSLLGLSWVVNGRTSGLSRSGLPGGSPDVVLAQLAKAHGIPIFALERPQAQVALLCGNPNGPVAALYLEEALRRGSDAPILANYERTQYQQGHVAMVVAAAHWPPGPETATAAALERQAFYAARNPAMLRRIEYRLGTPGFHVVVIGAGHFIGQEGIVANLRADGWEVTACPADRC
ncbi:TraB/GumN family protein [Acidisphaera sp. L21]|uniref:TraB/GumN family protein n=1 Tax=Acidisphaera sp. L21 TaxID=1641851 RepID=UPI00131A6656|nr:TraB/GumN family protein [Acidisphaera sp. L21]